jgi:hypothetical protein
MDNIHGKMVYSFEKPMWHNITEPSMEEMGAEEILDNRFGGGFSIFLRPVEIELNDERQETGDFAIVRGRSPYEDTERVFGYCSKRYTPLQPREVCRSFDNSVLEPAETMAFLGHGEDMFISWKMPSFDVRVGDEVESYGIVRTGFDTENGARLFTSIYRPVCANTITMAENWAKSHTDGKGKGNIWKGRGVNKNLLRDLGYWMEHVQTNAMREAQTLQNLFGKLATVPIKNDAEAIELLYRAYPPQDDVSPYYPKQLKADKQLTTLEFNTKQEALRDGIYELFAGAGTAITPDYWGMLCATSEYFCHVLPSKRPIAESVMFGGRQKHTMQMVKTLVDKAKAA